jgi:hypothetical protein
MGRWNDHDFDNFKFIIHELFLYLIASLIRSENLEGATYFLEQEYFWQGNSDYGRDAMVPFLVFCSHLKSLDARNQRLELRPFIIASRFFQRAL